MQKSETSWKMVSYQVRSRSTVFGLVMGTSRSRSVTDATISTLEMVYAAAWVS